MAGPNFCWHCGQALVRVETGYVFEVAYVQGAYRVLHKNCVEKVEDDPAVSTPHIFPEGPDFYKSYT